MAPITTQQAVAVLVFLRAGERRCKGAELVKPAAPRARRMVESREAELVALPWVPAESPQAEPLPAELPPPALVRPPPLRAESPSVEARRAEFLLLESVPARPLREGSPRADLRRVVS